MWLEDYELTETSNQRSVSITREADGSHDGSGVTPPDADPGNQGKGRKGKGKGKGQSQGEPLPPKPKKEKTEDQLARAVPGLNNKFFSFDWGAFGATTRSSDTNHLGIYQPRRLSK